jgi:hypothetical protein
MGLHAVHMDIDIGLQVVHMDIDIGLQAVHMDIGIGLQAVHMDIGIGLQAVHMDIGIGLQAVHMDIGIGLQAVHMGLQPRERRADVRPQWLELRHDETERGVERGTVRDEGGHVPLQVGHLVEEGGEMGQQQRQIARDLAQMWAQHIHPVEHAR